MKRCAQCGRESMDTAKFCESCGAQLPEDVVVDKVVTETTQDTSYEAPPLPEMNNTSYQVNGNNNSQPVPPNSGLVWLIISSIVTLLGCCCYGLGILQVPTIITSAISVSRHKNMDYVSAKKMSKISMILFFSILALMIIIAVIAIVGLVNNGGFENFDYNYFEDFTEGNY